MFRAAGFGPKTKHGETLKDRIVRLLLMLSGAKAILFVLLGTEEWLGAPCTTQYSPTM
jgi:hypothetical protein